MTEREQSHWGWGWADRFPGRLERLKLAARLKLGLGFGLGVPRSPRRLRSIELPASRVPVPEDLRERITDRDEDRIRVAYGRAYRDLVRGFAGDFAGAPDLVARPVDEGEVVRILDWAQSADLAVVPRGGGTNVVGATECREAGGRGVLVLDLGRLGRVVEVDPVSRAARIQAGATGPGLEAQLAEHGLTLRHYPQSFEFSTLGGWLATRSCGHYATGPTRIDDFVESIRAITPIGIAESRRLPASGAGPCPDGLHLGAEGTLGVITEAWMRVRPRPVHRSRADVHFATFGQGADAVRAIVQADLRPAGCRLLDGAEARLHGVRDDGRAVLILGFESADRSVGELLESALRLAVGAGGACPGGARHEGPGDGVDRRDAAGAWRRAFFDAPYLQTTLVSLGVMADTFETACTWDRFPDLDAALRDELGAALRDLCGAGHLSCRFTHAYPDGPAPYYTFVAPVARGAELATWGEVKAAATRILERHGATITHHHAVGRIHRDAYLRETPAPTLTALRAAKAAVDPRGILNPGALFAQAGGGSEAGA